MAAPSVRCEAAELQRPRAFSLNFEGRFGSLKERYDIVGCMDGVNVVMKHTFLELQQISVMDNAVVEDDASCCCSDHVSETTAAFSQFDGSCAWSDCVTDDEGELRTMAVPPGNLAVAKAPQFVAQCNFALPMTTPTVVPFDTKQTVEKLQRLCGSVWGGKKKQRKEQSHTTIVIKNLPKNCTHAMILELLDTSGFIGQYDFVYAPTDFRNYSAFGYAFVNFVTHEVADLAISQLNRCLAWDRSVGLDVSWSMPHQGYVVHVKRYQNSPVMHPDVPKEYKPMIFRNGIQQKFPEPTKRIKEPRLRRGAAPGLDA